MREDPIISGGLFKALLVVLVAAGLGIGAFAIAGNGVDIDLPDLPEVDSGQVTNLDNTTLQDTTINGGDPAEASLDPFTSAGFATALDAVGGAAGADAQLTRLFVNPIQTQFIVRRGADGIEAYSVRADSGELVREDATISHLRQRDARRLRVPARPVSSRLPSTACWPRRASTAAPRTSSPRCSASSGPSPSDRASCAGRSTPRPAGATCSIARRPTAATCATRVAREPQIPQAAQDAKKLNDCIAAAGSDTDEIFGCLDEF